MNQYMDVLGVKVSVTNPQEALRTIAHWIETRQKTYVCIAPVSTIVDCQSDAEYLQIINGAGMTTPDGMPLVWLGKLKGIKSLERTYGPDLMVALCGLSQGKGYRHYFYGGTTKTNELLLTKLKERFPQLIIAGAYAPPFLSMRDREEEHVLAAINQAQPDILWVGLGSPKQDYWMANHRDKLDVPVMIGIGAAFDFIAGTKPQAPVWMRTSGLEWFFRFCCEPKRLWKRYLVGNPKFLYLLCREALSNKRKVSCS